MVVRQYGKARLLSEARKRGTLTYLRTVQTVRRLLLAALIGLLVLQAMIMAAFGALVTGFMLWDADHALKLQILFGIFLGITLVPLGILVVLFSERLWYRLSGAERMVENLRSDQV